MGSIKGITWQFVGSNLLLGYDLHILRNNTPSPALDTQLSVTSDSTATVQTVQTLNTAKAGPNFAGNYPDFANYDSVKFKPRFANGGQIFNSIDVNLTTGVITATAPSGSDRIRTFIIDVILYRTGTIQVAATTLRVHVHNSVTTAWLGPSTLTIRPNISTYKFSVYAEFDDQTIGDLTTHSGLSWQSSNPTAVSVVASTGLLTATGTLLPVLISATLPAYLGGGNVSPGSPIIENSWQNTFYTAKLMPKSPGAHLKGTIPNVLLLADGFPVADKAQFEKYAAEIHAQLRSSSGATPWDVLFKSSINFWMVFLPSREKGSTFFGPYFKFDKVFSTETAPNPGGGDPVVTVKDHHIVTCSVEEYVDLVDAYLSGKQSHFYNFSTATVTIPNIGNRPGGGIGGGKLLLSQLIDYVGLPVEADSGITYANKVAEWQALYGASLNTTSVLAEVHLFWLAMKSWRLLDEKDTVLGLACGQRPRHSTTASDAARSISYNDERISRNNLNALLQFLTNEADGSSLAGIWDRPGGSPSKDFDFVMALSTSTRRAGANTQRYLNNILRSELLAFSTSDQSYISTTPGSGRRLVIDAIAYPNFLPTGVHATIAHELAHSFKLEDEYGDRTYPVNPDLSLKTEIRGSYNLILDEDIRNAGQLDGSLIKWRRLRMQKSAILTAVPSLISGADYSVTVKASQGARFKKDDIVYIKQRLPIWMPLDAAPQSQMPSPQYSAKFQVKATPTNTDTITITLLIGNPPGNDYGADDILMSPVPDPDLSVDHAELLSKVMRTHITSTQDKTFTSGENPNDLQGNMVQWPNPDNYPANLKRPKVKSRLVGLFEGGNEYKNGVYHPSGACIMRVPSGRSDSTLRPFCAICGYALIENIDPAAHMFFDKVINKHYPKT